MEDLPGYLVKPRYPIKMPERSRISSEDHTQETQAELLWGTESGRLPGVEMAPEERQAGWPVAPLSQQTLSLGAVGWASMYSSVFLHPQF